MDTPYAYTLEMPQALQAALESLRAALAAEQLGIVSTVDVQATLQARLGIQTHPQLLLGICSPTIALALLEAEPDIGALLPCGCSLAETQPGHTRLALQDPRVIAAASGSAEVRAVCERASAALRRVTDRLASTCPA
jgi:uncharacterized protein (DUF302 family)